MLSNWLRIGAATLFLAIGCLVVVAQQPVPAQPPVKGVPPGSPAANVTYRAKQVLGTKVAIQGNVSIGTVDDIVFDDAGNLEYLIVANEGKLVTVPWEAAKFNFAQKIATVNLTAEQYRGIPTYTTTTYPEFYAPTYRTEIYRSYGMTPRELRRLERRGVIP
jgi:hypothetical protein